LSINGEKRETKREGEEEEKKNNEA